MLLTFFWHYCCDGNGPQLGWEQARESEDSGLLASGVLDMVIGSAHCLQWADVFSSSL